MPAVSCPSCGAGLEVDATDLGHRVECPACRAVFTASTSPASPPPPPAHAPDSRVVVCTECRSDVSVATEDLGHVLQCPKCNGTFVAADPAGGRTARPDPEDDDRGPGWQRRRSERRSRYDDDEYDRPRRRSRYDDDDDEYDRPRRRRRSRYDDDYEDNSPEGLIAHAKRECGAAGVGLLVIAVWGMFSGLLVIVLYGAIMGGAFGGGGGPGAFGNMDPEEVWFNMGVSVVQLFVSGFLLYAGIQLRQAKQYGLCMIALVIAMLPAFSPCCVLGLVFGIIGITKLNDPRVKRGFEANRPGYQGDGYN